MAFEGPKTIKVRRIPSPGHFGITAYPRSVTTLGCELGKSGYKNGLTPEEETYYEGILGLKPGELNKHSSWWGKVFNVDYAIRLDNNKATEINTEEPIGQIKYKVLLASSKIANSEIEKKPHNLFYIDNAEAKAKAELETYNYEFESMKVILGLSVDEKRSSLRLFGKSGIDTLSENMLNAHLMNESKKDPKKFLETMTDKNVKAKGFIQELIEKGILIRKGNYFMHGEDTIAHSTDECVAYLNDPNNQSVRMVLESRLNKGKKQKA